MSPFEILAITFTNKAAGEMRERVAELVGPVGHRMWVSTFHAACSRILRREASLLGYRSSFTIYDQADAQRLTDWVRRDHNLDPEAVPGPPAARADQRAEERADPARASTRQMAVGPAERRISEVYTEYQRRLAEASAVDFDDLLVLTVRLFREHPEALDRYRSASGTCSSTSSRTRTPRSGSSCACSRRSTAASWSSATTHRSIYKFRGADFRNLLKFEEHVPRRDDRRARPELPVDAAHPRRGQRGDREQRVAPARSISGPTRATASRSSATRATTSTTKPRSSCARSTASIDGADHRYGDVAVFYRTNAQSRVLEESLVRSGVPYRVFGGVKFYDRREIKDALAYLRALVNPDDEVSWKRIVNTPRRGVGDTSVAKIDAYAQRRGHPVPGRDRARGRGRA